MALEQVAVPVVFHQNRVSCQKAQGSKTGVCESVLHFSFKAKEEGTRNPEDLPLLADSRHRREDWGQNGHAFTILMSHLCP